MKLSNCAYPLNNEIQGACKLLRSIIPQSFALRRKKWYCTDLYQYDREGHLHIVPCIEGVSACAGALDEDCDVWRIEVPTELSDLVRKECTASDGTLYGVND